MPCQDLVVKQCLSSPDVLEHVVLVRTNMTSLANVVPEIEEHRNMNDTLRDYEPCRLVKEIATTAMYHFFSMQWWNGTVPF
eukprot:3261293-Amphidinium_carterae.1